MKKIFFWANLLLNAIALVLAVLWARAQPGYEPWIAAIALVTSSISLLATKSHWSAPPAEVIQTGNVAGGDIAGRNITKKN